MLENPSIATGGRLRPKGRTAEARRIIDIRSKKDASTEDPVRKDILDGLRSSPPTLPTYILYDAQGLQLFDAITRLECYYPTASEISILTQHAKDLAASLPDNSTVVELGCGSLVKTRLLLYALERLRKKTSYYALDLSSSELKKAINGLDSGLKYVSVIGLHGTYDDGRKWLARARSKSSGPLVVLWLGSSIGNLSRDDAASFLSQFVKESLVAGDMFVIGIDRRNDPDIVWKAYNDDLGITRKFILNGLNHANRHLDQVFRLEDWEYEGVYYKRGGYHEAFYIAQRDVDMRGIVENESGHFPAGARIRVEQSWKYSPREAAILFDRCGLFPVQRWTDAAGMYDLHLLHVPPFNLSISDLDPTHVPNLDNWEELWKSWDLVSEYMMPDEMLQEKPISVRNECAFYRGHVPTFFDIKLTEAVPELHPLEPVYFHGIFARGIDPDLDDPSHVHWHSETPQSWPSPDAIRKYKGNVRDRIKWMYSSPSLARRGWRAIWMGFEHESMHLETLLYMLLQSGTTVPPPVPAAMVFGTGGQPSSFPDTTTIELHDIELGMMDREDQDDIVEPVSAHGFGWDNEKPASISSVSGKLEVSRKLITNADYLAYLRGIGSQRIPASWSGTVVRPAVKTVFGVIAFDMSDDTGPAQWPVVASYNDLQGYGKWKGHGWRLPSEVELRVIYDYSAKGPSTDGQYDIAQSNIGFKFWHPTALAPEIEIAGPGSMGVWEWTSTVLTRHEGFVPGTLYPEYTADFFDGKHNVVLGGSWTTHPRLSGRRSFRNWYQRAYEFAFVGGRLVRDAL
ncbi:histidine-specific methyltransferase [Lipomyces chichibuensis]|uniref:histidine-specific methyltransferase n=1 Tax=Lipomyces chichibuensis TaxID=1546026 RepID=UPI0033432C62